MGRELIKEGPGMGEVEGRGCMGIYLRVTRLPEVRKVSREMVQKPKCGQTAATDRQTNKSQSNSGTDVL